MCHFGYGVQSFNLQADGFQRHDSFSGPRYPIEAIAEVGDITGIGFRYHLDHLRRVSVTIVSFPQRACISMLQFNIPAKTLCDQIEIFVQPFKATHEIDANTASGKPQKQVLLLQVNDRIEIAFSGINETGVLTDGGIVI
ncbi:hypothetical protein SAMN04488515_3196 [Cognatiyoonia koreensis]|uniref:Uncharacterized protein n=1 Tax=Cognatiyoonia koreensis TaxID=364200 RepID=A0A1I0RSW5_9RHOB|nr:hypothetical protein SAMN04488515_3196 [Cognatiyoonia koreensis]